MYETLRRLYRAGRLTEAQLDTAVTRGWITAEQRDQIIAESMPPTTTGG